MTSRREFLIAGVGTVAASVAGCGGGSSEAAPNEGGAPNAPALPPPTSPQIGGRYRNQQPYLFQTVRAKTLPNRITTPVPGFDYQLESNAPLPVGPNFQWVDPSSGWKWDNVNGDWIDASLSRNSITPAPWFTIISPNTPGILTGSVTNALQYIQANNRWCAFKIQATQPRFVASTFSATPPVIAVTYSDLSTDTLHCRIVAVVNSSSSYPTTTSPAIQMPVFMEFDRPAKPVQSATISFTITQTFSGAGDVQGLILDPPMNSYPVVQGVAANYILDSGINADASVIGVHRYVDGINPTDFIYPTLTNISVESVYDPALFPFRGAGPDKTKLPWVSSPEGGPYKWVNAQYGDTNYASHSQWTFIPSTYTSLNFVPLAAGIGALQVYMYGNQAITDGFNCGFSLGYSTTEARIFLPASLWGIQNLFVRYYFRFTSPPAPNGPGKPYRAPLSKDYQQIQNAGATPQWTDFGGKNGIGPSHDTNYGGYSGSSGGGGGWQMRQAWHDYPHDDYGPDVNGMGWGYHLYDFNSSSVSPSPPQYRYGGEDQANANLGQQGGLGGVLYPDTWYCLESQMKLNTIPTDGSPGYSADGELRYWIDGRLAYQRTGMVFRTSPLYNPGYKATALRPTAFLGHRNLLFNWFHGGGTQNTVDRCCFISELVWGTKYIGPMRNS